MKKRCGFVTNSSSSSFVVCRKSDCKRFDVNKDVIAKLDNIVRFINGNEHLFTRKEFGKAICDAIDNGDYENAANLIASKIVNEIINVSNYKTVDIDGWKIGCTEYSSEGNVIDYLMYSIGSCFNGEVIRVGEQY